MSEKQPFIDRLKEADRFDPEVAHGCADQVLLDALRAAGWGEVADAWESMQTTFWYA